MEAQKEDLEASIAQAELAHPKYTKDEMVRWISQFKYGDVDSLDYQRQIIDAFLNSIRVFDNRLIITYNYKDGTETISLADIEAAVGSDLGGSVPRHAECRTGKPISGMGASFDYGNRRFAEVRHNDCMRPILAQHNLPPVQRPHEIGWALSFLHHVGGIKLQPRQIGAAIVIARHVEILPGAGVRYPKDCARQSDSQVVAIHLNNLDARHPKVAEHQRVVPVLLGVVYPDGLRVILCVDNEKITAMLSRGVTTFFRFSLSCPCKPFD